MCLLVVAKHCRPESRILEMGLQQNPDGIGVAFNRGKKIHYIKGIELFDLEEILEIEEPPFVVHFRWASAGGPHPGLCHPFPVTKEYNLDLEGDADAIIAHNGHVRGWERMAYEAFVNTSYKMSGGPWSDTRFLSWLVANNGPDILKFFNEKVAYMTAKGIRIFNEGEFYEHKQKKGSVMLSYNVFEMSQMREMNNWFISKGGGDPNMARAALLKRNLQQELEDGEYALASELDEATIAEIEKQGEDAELFESVIDASFRLKDHNARIFE